jgi:hypothetical protein
VAEATAAGVRVRLDPGAIFPSLRDLGESAAEDEDVEGSFRRVKAAVGQVHLLETK